MSISSKKGHKSSVHCLKYSTNGLISCSEDTTIKIWGCEKKIVFNPNNCKCLKTLKGHQQPIYCIDVIPDNGNLLSGSLDKTLRIWDLEGNCIKVIDVKSTILCLKYLKNGYVFLGKQSKSKYKKNNLKILNLEIDQELFFDEANSHNVEYLPSNGRLLSCNEYDGSILTFEFK